MIRIPYWLFVVAVIVASVAGLIGGCVLGVSSAQEQAIENNAAHWELVDPAKNTTKFCWGPAPVKKVKTDE